MADTIYLNDGTTEVIFGNKRDAFERLLREKLGYDAAEYFKDILREHDEDMEELKESANEHERSADGYLDMCRDALNSLEEIALLLREPRLNRKELQEAVESARCELDNNL